MRCRDESFTILCDGVTSKNIVEFLQRSNVHLRPRGQRLSHLGLAECDVDFSDIPQLDGCVSYTRDFADAFDLFDFWGCGSCQDVISFEDTFRCEDCDETICQHCAATHGNAIFSFARTAMLITRTCAKSAVS